MADIIKGYTFSNNEVVTPAKVHKLVDDATVADLSITSTKIADGAIISAKIADGTIVNADINADADIADTKLATISTTGKVSNSATTATNANTANAIVARDASGNFSAGRVTASQTIPKGGSLIFADTFGTDYELTGNSTDDKLFLRSGGQNILEIDSTTGAPVWKFKQVGSSKIGLFKDNPATALDVNGIVTATSFAGNNIVPIGAVMPFAMNSAPTGWLAADGAEYSKTGTYADLFAVIGTAHGETNGSGGAGTSHFRVPDLRGIFVRGSGSQTISGTTYSGTFAAKQQDLIKDHTHTLNGAPSTGGAGGLITRLADNLSSFSSGGASGSGTETRPANIALLYCIKF